MCRKIRTLFNLDRGSVGAGLVAASSLLSASPPHAQQVDVWSRPVKIERSRSCDFIHYRIELAFDLDAKVFRGENRITLAPLGEEVDRCVIDAEEIIIETLDIDGGSESVELVTAAARDENSRVRMAAIRLLGERSDPGLSAFFRDRFTNEESYLVQAEALKAIGWSGDRSQLPFLREASKMKSPRDVIRSAAEWAIEKISEGQ